MAMLVRAEDLESKPPEATPVGNRLSWVHLVTSPAKFDKKPIIMTGWLSVTRTPKNKWVFVLWLNREAFDYRLSTEALYLDSASLEKLLPQPESTWPEFHGERVLIEGVFGNLLNKENAEFPGEIVSIKLFHQLKPGGSIYDLRRQPSHK